MPSIPQGPVPSKQSRERTCPPAYSERKPTKSTVGTDTYLSVSIFASWAGGIVSELDQGSAAFFSCPWIVGTGIETRASASKKVSREIISEAWLEIFRIISETFDFQLLIV